MTNKKVEATQKNKSKYSYSIAVQIGRGGGQSSNFVGNTKIVIRAHGADAVLRRWQSWSRSLLTRSPSENFHVFFEENGFVFI